MRLVTDEKQVSLYCYDEAIEDVDSYRAQVFAQSGR